MNSQSRVPWFLLAVVLALAMHVAVANVEWHEEDFYGDSADFSDSGSFVDSVEYPYAGYRSYLENEK